MKRKIYLEGEIGRKFGYEFDADVSSVRDAFRLLEANNPSLKKYLIECNEKGIGFTIDVADKSIEKEDDLILPLQEGDITITAVPAGSKDGISKILTAIAIIIAIWYFPVFGTAGGTLSGLSTWGYVALSVAVSLGTTGLQQLMAPDPATDSDSPTSYMFNGSEQNVIEGDPVPILYGELRVPGRPIAFGVVNNVNTYNSMLSGSSGGGGGDTGGEKADNVVEIPTDDGTDIKNIPQININEA